ncbi:MAG: hypothetical protein ACT4QF_14445, partial [Sporichthyaceae bacterium]
MSKRSETATATVDAFFAAYKKRNVIGMAETCSARASFDAVPFVSHDKSRLVTGSGYVNGVGRTIWGLGFRAFPDLTTKVTDTFADDDGNVVAEVTISGTQQAPYLTAELGVHAADVPEGDDVVDLAVLVHVEAEKVALGEHLALRRGGQVRSLLRAGYGNLGYDVDLVDGDG